MLNILEKIFLKILSTEDALSHYLKILITPVFLKNDSCKLENYRAIDLLSIPRKSFNRIVLNNIREKQNKQLVTDNMESDTQSH